MILGEFGGGVMKQAHEYAEQGGAGEVDKQGGDGDARRGVNSGDEPGGVVAGDGSECAADGECEGSEDHGDCVGCSGRVKVVQRCWPSANPAKLASRPAKSEVAM